MDLNNYIESLNQRYKLGNATEHTFRGDLQLLLESLLPDVRATNEPKRQKVVLQIIYLQKMIFQLGL